MCIQCVTTRHVVSTGAGKPMTKLSISLLKFDYSPDLLPWLGSLLYLYLYSCVFVLMWERPGSAFTVDANNMCAHGKGTNRTSLRDTRRPIDDVMLIRLPFTSCLWIPTSMNTLWIETLYIHSEHNTVLFVQALKINRLCKCAAETEGEKRNKRQEILTKSIDTPSF